MRITINAQNQSAAVSAGSRDSFYDRIDRVAPCGAVGKRDRQRDRIGDDRRHVQRERIQRQVVLCTYADGLGQRPQQGIRTRILLGA